MEKNPSIIKFEILNNIELTETKDLIFGKSRNENIKNVYKLNQNREVIALNLCNNGLKKIQGLSLLQNLEELYLEGNQIEDLYFINYHSKLKILNVSNNLLNDNTINVSINSIEKLYLDNNKLTTIPYSTNWRNLKVLSLSQNSISRIYSAPYFKLEELILNNNELEKIEGLEIFINLKKLDLSYNKITVIQNLNIKSLESLDLVFNQIKKIENLENLSNLKSLTINDNSIGKIENLFNKKLNNLELSSNKIEIIENLENLENLNFLGLSNNQIKSIKGLDKLSNIVLLNLHMNNITIIEGLDKLINLEYLFLGFNKITSLKGLGKLKKLRSLFIYKNSINKIEEIENLKKLSTLDLSSNLITRIENDSELINLTDLNLSNNQIEDLKDCEQLLNLTKLERLKIHDNPFLTRENILLYKDSDHLDTIKNELEKLQKEKKEIKLPVKVMLLGNHASGKSTFLDYFFTNKIKNKNESTHILKIANYPRYYKRRKSELPSIIFYDFGGQDYYHGVYQAFLTLNTINLLFWQNKTDNISKELDAKKEKIINFDKQYWLQQIDFANSQRRKYFVDTTEEINYVIQTHADCSNQKHTTEGNIKQTFFISLLENHKSKKNEFALKYLKEAVKEEIRLHSKLVNKTKNEIDLYRYISKYEKDNWIDVKDLVEIYKSSLSNLKAELEQLSMNGMILYYKNIISLENYVWLNPSKTVEKIHEILSVQRKGKIEKKEFEKQINDKIIIEMLQENKVIFFDDHDDHYIIPGYLDFAHEDKDEFFYFAEFDIPNFILRFSKFIPFGLINQLICHFGKNPEKKIYWRNQLVFTHNNNRIRIKINFELLEIQVFIKSIKKNSIKDIEKDIFLDIIHLYWDEKIPTFESLKSEKDELGENEFIGHFYKTNDLVKEKELILSKIIEDLYISIDGKRFIHHMLLQSLEKSSLTIPSYVFDDNQLSVSRDVTILDFKNFTNNINIKTMKKIFISYSRKDVDYKDELKKHLNILNTFSIADNWSCEEITIGKWDDQIQKELSDSDLIIYMLSANFFASKYILNDEVKRGMDLIDQNPSKKILCVIVSEFVALDRLKTAKENRDDLQQSILRLSEYQYLPYGKIPNTVSKKSEEKIIPLTSYNDHGDIDSAFTQITNKVFDILK